MDRVMTSRISDLHFVPSAAAQKNLLAEGISGKMIFKTGNTVIDALFFARNKVKNDLPPMDGVSEEILNGVTPIVLITGHRR